MAITEMYWKNFLYLEKRFEELTRYVDLHEDNLPTFSVEIMNLYLSACSEIEAVYKEIFSKVGESMNFDEFKAEVASLNESWKEFLKQPVTIDGYLQEIYPFRLIIENTEESTYSKWWKNHNAIKHNRQYEWKNAKLGFLVEALAGLFILNLCLYFHKFQLERISKWPSMFGVRTHGADLVPSYGMWYCKR